MRPNNIITKYFSVQFLDKETYGWRSIWIGIRYPYRKRDTDELGKIFNVLGPKGLAKIAGDKKLWLVVPKKWVWEWTHFRI